MCQIKATKRCKQNTKTTKNYQMIENDYFSKSTVFRIQKVGKLAILQMEITAKASIPPWKDVTIGNIDIRPEYQNYFHCVTDNGVPVRVSMNTNGNVVIGAGGAQTGGAAVIRFAVPFIAQ